MNKLLFLPIAIGLWFMTWMFSYSCVFAATDREVWRAVEGFVTRWEWEQRKPLLQGLQWVIPQAKEKLKNSDTALTILDQIDLAISKKISICTSEIPSKDFANSGLETNTSIASIDLSEILSGWPPKDGIPALRDPKFTDTDTARWAWYLTNTSEWIVVSEWDDARFYPYQILNWHEIVNDTVGDQHIAITFCPLCGTAITFGRELDGKVVNFWVSGKLYNSNLLMYDDITESLWSQAIGKWVVWFYTDLQLEYIDSDVISFWEFAAQYPNGKVLSDDTWYGRNYKIDSPYGDYDTNEELYFPVSNSDSSLPKKTMLYIANDTEMERSLWWIQEDLAEAGSASIDADGISYTAVYRNGKVQIIRNSDGTTIGNFTQMRFSWTAHENYPRYLWEW